MKKTIMQQLKEANIPIDTHESDLYCLVTPESTKIISDCNITGWIINTFTSRIDGKLWYDIPFANDDFWDRVQNRNLQNRS
jgi:hypothetical protein